MVPEVSKKLLAYAATHYKDFMLTPPEGVQRPAWFMLFMWMEPLFHVPVGVWAVRGLTGGEFYFLLFLFTLGLPAPFLGLWFYSSFSVVHFLCREMVGC